MDIPDKEAELPISKHVIYYLFSVFLPLVIITMAYFARTGGYIIIVTFSAPVYAAPAIILNLIFINKYAAWIEKNLFDAYFVLVFGTSFLFWVLNPILLLAFTKSIKGGMFIFGGPLVYTLICFLLYVGAVYIRLKRSKDMVD